MSPVVDNNGEKQLSVAVERSYANITLQLHVVAWEHNSIYIPGTCFSGTIEAYLSIDLYCRRETFTTYSQDDK